MSNQIVITSGAKVRSLEGVLTGTSGVVSSVPLGAANGVATLDSGGKVPVSQLPSSVVTYLGTWNAATNTPTLVNGVGDAGDMYICNVAGTVNFGAGPVTFAVGDWVLYGSGTWQKSNGQNGTVTSVGASITGNAIGLTGSPITTAGTLAFAFSGTSGQYVNGAGNLTTFPTLITSIGLSMPSAFSVANSPLTANGSINVTGAGTTAQYIDGTGALQTFPALTGYVPYTGATADVDLGTHVLNAQALHVKGTAGAGHLGLKHQTASPTGSANESLIFADVNGNLGWQNDNLYLTTLVSNANTANRSYTFPNASGTLALTSDISYPVTSVFGRTGAVTAQSGDYTTTLVTEGTRLYYTDARARAALSFTAGSGAYNSTTGVITIPTNTSQLTNGANFITLASLSAGTGISYNNLTGVITSTITQYTDAMARAAISGGTGISYNSTTGVITNTITQYTDALARAAISLTTTGTSGAATYNSTTGVLNIPQYTDAYTGTVTSVAMTVPTGLSVSGSPITTSGTLAVTLTAGYSIPTTASQTNWDTAYTNRITSATSPLSITSNVISISQATTSTSGYLSSTDWNTFNSKQGTITLTTTGSSGAATLVSNTLNIPNYTLSGLGGIGGSGTANYLPKFTAGTTIGNSAITDDGSTVALLSRALNVSGASTLTGRVTSVEVGVTKDGADTIGDGPWFRWTNAAVNRQMLTQLNASNGLTTWAYNGSGWTSLLTLTQSGNLGLGVTPSAWNSIFTAIDFSNTASLAGSSGGSNLFNNAYYNGTSYVYKTTDYAQRYLQGSGIHAWYTAPSGTAGTAISFTQAMTLDASGRLGIGTAIPSYNLEIYNAAGASAVIGAATGKIYVYGDDNGGTVGTLSSIPLRFATNATERMRIFSTGNILLQNGGTFTDAGYLLDVNGTGRFNGSSNTILTLDSTAGSGYTAVQINFSGTAKALIGYGSYLTTDGGVAIRTAASTPFTIAIGSASPNFTIASSGAATFSSSVTANSGVIESGGFNIKGTGGIAKPDMLRLSNASAGAYYWDIWRDNTTGYLNFGGATGGSVSTFLTIKDVSGNVGIGTASPDRLFTIAPASGDAYINLKRPVAASTQATLEFNTAGTNDWLIRTDDASANLKFYSYGISSYALILARSTGAATFSSTIKTAGFGSTTARPWKLGELVSATVIGVNTTGYLTVEVNGSQYNLALANLA